MSIEKRSQSERIVSVSAYKLLVEAIVTGQVKDFINSHPDILDCVLWFKPSTDKRQVFINSVSKRILADLTSEDTINKIRIALVDGLLPEHTAGNGRGDREGVGATHGTLPSSGRTEAD